VRVIYRKLR